jgi:hypothetical protein
MRPSSLTLKMGTNHLCGTFKENANQKEAMMYHRDQVTQGLVK